MSPSGGVDVMPQPIGIGGPGMVAQPEGLFAVGPGGNPIPDNPFDPRAARTSAEAIRPMMQQSISGGEMSVPQSLDPNARMGIGPRDNQGPVQSFTNEGLPLPGKSAPQQTVDVQGDYNKPPEIEPAPITERGMPPAKFRIMVMENGKPRPVAGMREAGSAEEAAGMVDTLNSYGTDEFSVQRIEPTPQTPRGAGDLPSAIKQATDQNGLANVAAVVKAFGGDVKEAHKAILDAEAKGAIELRPEGGLNRLSPEELQMSIPGPDNMVLSNIRVIDEPMLSKESRSPLERSLDEQLGSPDAPPVPKTEIEEAGARQTADREQVAQNQKAYVDDIFSPGREARAREMEKFEELAKNPQIIEEAIEAVKKVDARLGPMSVDEKRKAVVSIIEKKLGRPVDVEDLIRAGLIGSGMVQLATDEDGSGEGATLAGMGFFGRGKGGRRSGTPGGPSSVIDDLKGPSRPPKPKQLQGKTADGKPVEGFSALRAQQHDRLTAIEEAKKRIGVGKDQTVEDRIRTFGQQEGRLGTDETLLAEAKKIGKEKELRTAAGAAVYPHMKARAQGGAGDGVWNKLADFFMLRGYKASELLAGRFDNKNIRNPFAQRAPAGQPFWEKGKGYADRIMQSAVEDPARRLLDLSRGAQGARHGDDLRRIIEALQGDDYYEENKRQRSP